MADPLSIIGLLGTAGALTKTILKYASAVKDAPKKLEELSRELTNLHDMFEMLVKFLEGEKSRDDFAEISTLFDATGVRFIIGVFSMKAF